MSETKILFAGDLHKRAKDITTIEGYVNCNIAVQSALIEEIEKRNIDYFVSLGDWYDKGYIGDVSASLADYDLDIRMHDLLKGNFYGVIGNHIRLNMDSNPELHLIQPHPMYKSRRPCLRRGQIIRTPEVLRIGNVQLSLMHNKINAECALDYKPIRQPWAVYHIAVFHTELVVPYRQLANTNYGYIATSSTQIANTMSGVDLAIVGHVHNVLGKFQIESSSGVMTMVVPGSLTNVDSGESSRHTSVALPLVTIVDNRIVRLEFLPFDLKTNLVTFKKKNVEKSNEKLKTIRGKGIMDLHDSSENSGIVNDSREVLLSLNLYMKSKGYTEMDKNLVRSVLNDPESLTDLLKVYLAGRV